MKKSLTLIEVLVAVAIFGVISVSLFSLLHTGISVRKKVKLDQTRAQNVCLNLENIAKNLRNIVLFKKGDPQYPLLQGDGQSLQFYALSYDYLAKLTKIVKLSYGFKQGVLARAVAEPLGDDQPVRIAEVLEDLQELRFYYYLEGAKEGAWQPKWEETDRLPQGIKIAVKYKNSQGQDSKLEKYVFIHTNFND